LMRDCAGTTLPAASAIAATNSAAAPAFLTMSSSPFLYGSAYAINGAPSTPLTATTMYCLPLIM
jgi:hypothetical protein